jgi:hypothetical protein
VAKLIFSHNFFVSITHQQTKKVKKTKASQQASQRHARENIDVYDNFITLVWSN